MSDHDKLKQNVYDAIEAFVADSDVPQKQTIQELKEMQEEIEDILDSMDEDEDEDD